MSSIVSDVLDLMADEVVVTPIARDYAGNWVASGEVLTLPCYIEREQRLVRSATGREVVSSLLVIVGGYNDLTVDEHLYTLPSRFQPNASLTAISVDKVSDEDGECYEELTFP